MIANGIELAIGLLLDKMVGMEEPKQQSTAEEDAENQIMGEALSKFIDAYNKNQTADINAYLEGLTSAQADEVRELANTWLSIKKEFSGGWT